MRIISSAWSRNGDGGIITGEALILACLMKTHANQRGGSDLRTVQALMKDINLEKGK